MRVGSSIPYPTHIDDPVVVLPLQKLVHVHENDCDCSDIEIHTQAECKYRPHGNGLISTLYKLVGLGQPQVNSLGLQKPANPGDPQKNYDSTNEGSLTSQTSLLPICTLQQYHGGPNQERNEFMEKYSALASKGLAVAVEQVSIFLSSDNTVVSFFEQSAEDVENPIIDRLSSCETTLRRSSDASMVVQAIIDAIIDLAIPVTNAYRDAIDELELNVLTGML